MIVVLSGLSYCAPLETFEVKMSYNVLEMSNQYIGELPLPCPVPNQGVSLVWLTLSSDNPNFVFRKCLADTSL